MFCFCLCLQKQLAETRSDLDKDRSVLQANREQLRLAADELVQLKKELSAAEAKLTSLPQKGIGTTSLSISQNNLRIVVC